MQNKNNVNWQERSNALAEEKSMRSLRRKLNAPPCISRATCPTYS